MILTHRDHQPTIDPSAYIAPTAVVCGDVTIGPGSCVGFNAVLVAEGAPLIVGSNCIVRENAVVRSVTNHPVRIGNNVLIGPGSSLTGCTVEDECFLATNVTIFHDAVIRRGAEIRINAIVHVKTVVPEDATVPIAWVAVGDPVKILPPNEHDAIWETLRPLNFPTLAYGVPRSGDSRNDMRRITRVVSESLSEHHNDLAL
jgi:carbonic anhydrase/acetyltransferase-like protein (isoleucine patch superfamily)